MELIAINSVTASSIEHHFVANATFKVGEDTITADVGVTPTDTNGIVPLVRQWMSDNAGTITIEPYVPPTAEQQRAAMPPLTARQLRLGLINNGITPAQVQATIEAMPAGADREKALVEWEYASTFSRMHPLLASVGAAVGLTDEQIDEMWMAAASL